jgi:hypothetical protein
LSLWGSEFLNLTEDCSQLASNHQERDLISKMLPDLQGAQVLIGSHGTITQSMLEAVGASSVRAADLHGFAGPTAERNFTLIAIGKLVAELGMICNFTPQAFSLKNKLIEQRNLLVIPFVVPSVVSSVFSPTVQSKASVSLSVLQYFNFLYCAADLEVQPTNFYVLLKPFRLYCWICMIICSLILPLVLKLELKGNNTRYGYFRLLFVILSALVSQGTNTEETIILTLTRNNTRKLSRSKILILWILFSFVLNNIYSGALTSFLISPVEKDVIKDVAGLDQNRHRLIYTDKGFFGYIMLMVEQMIVSINSNSGSNERSPLQNLYLGKIVKSSIPLMIDALAFESKTALFGPYALILTYWSMLTMKISQERYTQLGKKLRRECHIGKYLDSAFSVPEVWIFRDLSLKENVPNRTETEQSQILYINLDETEDKGDELLAASVGKVFDNLHDNGIHAFWMDVFFRIQVANRAQDVNRFKSRTEVTVEVPVQPMGLYNGSSSIIFVVYLVCIGVCIIAFLCEVLVHRVRV